MSSIGVDARLEGLSGRQLLDLAGAAVARHAAGGAVDGAGLLAHARAVVGLAGGEVLDATVDDWGLRDGVAGWHRLEAGVAAEKLWRLGELAERQGVGGRGDVGARLGGGDAGVDARGGAHAGGHGGGVAAAAAGATPARGRGDRHRARGRDRPVVG